MKEKLAAFARDGYPLVQRGEFTGGRYAYIDTEKAMELVSAARDRRCPSYFPIQKLLKMRFRMSSAVVSPVIESSGRRTL